MKVLKPHNTINAELASDVTITETLWISGTYDAGDKVYLDDTFAGYFWEMFEALDTTTDSPIDGYKKETPTWKKIGKINRWRMFDKKQGTQTEKTASMTVGITPLSFYNGAAFLNLEGETLKVTLSDSIEGVVFEKEYQLLDNSNVFDWHTFFYAPYLKLFDVFIPNLPVYGGSTLTMELTAEEPTDVVKCGEFLLGDLIEIGYTQLASDVGITDFSRKEQDDFGNYFIEERPFIKRATFDVQIETVDVTRVQRLLAGLRATPTFYAGDETTGALFIYGFFRDFDIVISNPALSSCVIEVEGL